MTMTPRQRLLTALRRQQPDRVPITLRMWKFLRKYYRHIPDLTARMLRAQEEFGIDIYYDLDFVPTPLLFPDFTCWRDDVTVELHSEVRGDKKYWRRTVYTPEGDLSDTKWASHWEGQTASSTPEVLEPLIKDPKRDIPRLRYMLADPAKFAVAAAWETDRRIGERGLGVVHLYSPLDHRDVMRQADFMLLYYDDRGAFREIVEIMAEGMLAETKGALDAGFKVFQTWWFYCSPSYGWSPKIYEEMFLPHLVRQVALVHSYPDTLYIYYDDGRLMRFADFYVDAGIDCLMTLTPPPMGDADPQTMKEGYGHRIALMGGIDVVNEVCWSTPEKIREMVRQRLEVYKPGGGYVCDGSNSIPYETPLENVRALADAAREYGGY
ncbi:MAG: hypothetical protein IT330_07675 [Anaerolineae bacterium]|nr:hypothetical protein [Anaerolineae bacterium]